MAAVRDRGTPHVFALQIEDAANGFAREQLETGRMHPGQHDRGNAGVDRRMTGGGKILAEVHFSARDVSRYGRR